MALALAESLAMCKRYRPAHVFVSYLRWWDRGVGMDAWDTGPTSQEVFDRALTAPAVASALASPMPESFDATILTVLDGISRAIDLRLDGRTAGANAAHRIAPLAAAFFVDSDALASAASCESRLTHYSPISQDCCVFFSCICRLLIEGEPWHSVVEKLPQLATALCPSEPSMRERVMSALSGSTAASSLSRGGFCPDVIQAALLFVNRHATFAGAMAEALSFAGPANYSPVLVGALAGARFGYVNLPRKLLADCRPGVEARCVAAGTTLALPTDSHGT
jgi:ADP-ribosylglycohydrolase